MTQTVSGMDANTTRIEGLDAKTDYEVQVSASNGAGTGVMSQVVTIATVSTPIETIEGWKF